MSKNIENENKEFDCTKFPKNYSIYFKTPKFQKRSLSTVRATPLIALLT